jgi:hypothetical protein
VQVCSCTKRMEMRYREMLYGVPVSATTARNNK